MGTYTITATRDDRTEVETVEAPDDDQATMDAIDIIMDNAWLDNGGLWATGAITLTDPNGNVLQTMAAK